MTKSNTVAQMACGLFIIKRQTKREKCYRKGSTDLI